MFDRPVSISIHAVLCVLVMLIGSLTVNGQLVVQGGFTAQQLAEVISGPGITVSNAVITGSPQAHGTFNGVNSKIAHGGDVILRNGIVVYAMASMCNGLS